MADSERRSIIGRIPGGLTPWSRAAFRPLAVASGLYLLVLIFYTHVPRPEKFLPANPPGDKTLHLLAYGVLGGLVCSTAAARGGWSMRLGLSLVGGLLVFAMLDEATQPFFGRYADLFDWLFDGLGLVAGMIAVAMGVAGLRAWR